MEKNAEAEIFVDGEAFVREEIGWPQRDGGREERLGTREKDQAFRSLNTHHKRSYDSQLNYIGVGWNYQMLVVVHAESKNEERCLCLLSMPR